MKTKIYSTIIALLLCVGMYAQAPQKFSYQAVVYNASNQLVVNASVGLKIAICKGTPESAPVYVETHKSTTNANGLVTIEIGTGIVVVAGNRVAFSAIDWSSGIYYIRTKIDPTGGVNYDLITLNTQLLSVPYALYAEKSGTAGAPGAQGIQGEKGDKGEKGDRGETGVFQKGNTLGDMYYWNGTRWQLLAVGGEDKQLVVVDGKPVWGPILGKVNILSVDSIRNDGAFITAQVTSGGGTGITARGFCWSTNSNPVVADTNTTINGNGKGAFSANIRGLKPATTYHVRPYATNSVGTVYGAEMSFTTTNWQLKGTGQAGGLVFYDKGFYSDGWRFIELSLVDMSSQWISYNGNNAENLIVPGANHSEIGAAKINTLAIVEFFAVGRISAAQKCLDYEFNGFDDWYLPTENEGKEIIKTLIDNNLGDMGGKNNFKYYFTSSDVLNNFGTYVMTYSSATNGIYKLRKQTTLNIRAIRYF